MRITRNLAFDYLRKSKHETPDETIVGASDVSTDSLADFVTDKVELEEALRALPDVDREIFVMHLVWDASYLSISRALHIPLATVSWKYSRSVKAMQKILTV